MSWNVCLTNKSGEICKVDIHEEGGTYALGGIDQADLNITYNYSRFFYRALDKKDGLGWLTGKTGRSCVKRLGEAVKKLGTKQAADYWAMTPGNAGFALSILLKWAKQYPDAVFEVS